MQRVERNIRQVGRLLPAASAASDSKGLGFLYLAHLRLAECFKLVASIGLMPPPTVCELYLDYLKMYQAAADGEAVIGRKTVVTRGPDGWRKRLKTAH